MKLASDLGADFNDGNSNHLYIKIRIRKQKCIFESFFCSGNQNIIPVRLLLFRKMEYNVLESEVYSLCI